MPNQKHFTQSRILSIVYLLFSFFALWYVFLGREVLTTIMTMIPAFYMDMLVLSSLVIALVIPSLLLVQNSKKQSTTKEGSKSSLQTPMALIVLFLFALFCRLPYFVSSEINWDESTFALMGQDLIEGHLPYTHLWDMKPPFVFFIYAVAILIFGKGILTIRLLGLFCVFLASGILYRTVKELFGGKAGLWAGIIFILTTSLQAGTMTEHLTLVPMSILLLYLLRKEYTLDNVCFMGIMMGLILLIRTNLVYCGIIVAFILAAREYRYGFKNLFSILFVFGLGVAFLPLLTVMFYSLDGSLDLLIQSAVTAPLKYVTLLSQTFEDKFNVTLVMFKERFFVKDFMIWSLFAGGLTSIFMANRSPGDATKKDALGVVLLLFMAAVYSVIVTGRAHPHYFLQWTIFMSVFAGVYLARLSQFRIKGYYVLWIVVAVILLKPTFIQYRHSWVSIYQGQPLRQDTGHKILKYLKTQNISKEYIFFCEYHIGYWLLDVKKPTKFIHPSNISREHLMTLVDGHQATIQNEINAILRKKPLFIIKSDRPWYFDEYQNQRVNFEVEHNYVLVKRVDHIGIYRRKM